MNRVCVVLFLKVLVYTFTGITGRIAFIDFPDSGVSPSTTCTLNSSFTVTVRYDDYLFELKLEKNSDVDENAPIYVFRSDIDGVVKVIEEVVLDIQDSAEYQDRNKLASVEITCRPTTDNFVHFHLDGMIILPDGKMYKTKFISRVNQNIRPSFPGDIYDLSSEDEEADLSQGAAVDDVHDDVAPDEMKPAYRAGPRRLKRESQPVYIDVITFIEFTVYERWYNRSTVVDPSLRRSETLQNMRRHFALLLNGINLRYKSASERYNFRLVGYVIEDTGLGEWLTRVGANETNIDGIDLLASARNWTNTVSNFPESDHILTWTGYDLFWIINGVYGNLLGVAYSGTICKFETSSISLIEYHDNMINDMLIATHEIGHAMSARHDGDQNDCLNSDSNIMKAGYTNIHSLDNNNQYLFSSCSAEYFRTFVDGLLNGGTVSVPNITGLMPGQLYDPDTQCKMVYGEESYFCRNYINPAKIDTMCKRMHCYDKAAGRCRLVNAAEGTSCGDKKWCVAGICESSDNAPRGNSTCLFGDTPGIVVGSLTCETLIPPGREYYCYHNGNLFLCCGTCQSYETNDPDCLYGDNKWNTTCDADKCLEKVGTNYITMCCDTCRQYRTTTTSSTATTTTPTTMTSTTTATTMTSSPTTPTIVTSTTTATTITSSQTTTATTTQTAAATSTTAEEPCEDNSAYEASVGSSCGVTVAADRSQCYNETLYSKCCLSCRQKLTGIKGCEYGNKDPSFCSGKEGSSCCGHRDTCCFTCDVEAAMCSGGTGVGLHPLVHFVMGGLYLYLDYKWES